MKQIIKNIYVKGFSFSSLEEASTFVGNQKAIRSIFLENTSGDNYYCYVCYHALTKEKLLVLSFGSDENKDNLNFLFWGNLLVFDTGRNLYIMDETLNIVTNLEFTTPLIGLYEIDNERLLLLEEAYLRIVNRNGEIVKSELFDVIEDFRVEGNMLFIQTSKERKVINLL